MTFAFFRSLTYLVSWLVWNVVVRVCAQTAHTACVEIGCVGRWPVSICFWLLMIRPTVKSTDNLLPRSVQSMEEATADDIDHRPNYIL